MMNHRIKFSTKKGSAIQKISSRQTLTDILKFCCDLDLEHNNPISPYNTLAYDNVVSNQVWQQKDQQFKRYSRIVIF